MRDGIFFTGVCLFTSTREYPIPRFRWGGGGTTFSDGGYYLPRWEYYLPSRGYALAGMPLVFTQEDFLVLYSTD